MAKLPLVAIIGRPNTGKSTLFNALTGTRNAIVSPIAGTTRDHIACKVETEKMDFLLLDTGGIGGGSSDHEMESDVSAQSLLALRSADLILLTFNARDPLTGADQTIVDVLRTKRKHHVPVIIVATKCDKPGTQEEAVPEYLSLGIAEEVIPTSAVHRQGIEALEEAIGEHLRALHFTKELKVEVEGEPKARSESDIPRVAVIGRPNVGKSSLLNALMSPSMREVSPRIVSDIPGTTRDASDTTVVFHGTPYTFVDTAGIRKQARVEEGIEYLSVLKSMQAMEQSDVVLLILDAHEPTSKQDKHIAGLAIEAGKALILVLNKADLLTPAERQERAEEVLGTMTFCRFAPMLFVSAKTKDNLLKLFPLIESVHRNRLRRIPTSALRDWFEGAVRGVPAKSLSSAKHVTQASDPPPTFVLFVRSARSVQQSQLRYMENSLRATFSFEGTPIRWVLKQSAKRDRRRI